VSAVLAADTAAIYMGAGDAVAISQALISAGKPAGTPVAVVENASLDLHTVLGRLDALPSLAAQLSGGPALIFLGEVFSGAAAATRQALPRQSLAR